MNLTGKTKLRETYINKNEVLRQKGKPVFRNSQASGDSLGRCCSLCGGGCNLQGFGDRCLLDGAVETYDHLLAKCFGDMVSGFVSSDSMICENCIYQLRNTQKFRALVQAAIEKPAREGSEESPENFLEIKKPVTNVDVSISHDKITSFKGDVLSMINNRQVSNANPRRKKRGLFSTNAETKKMILTCEMCRHKYPMMKAPEDCSKFVCSRCKLRKNSDYDVTCKKCNLVMPSRAMKDHMEKHVNSDLRGKRRLYSLPNQLRQVKNNIDVIQKSLHCDSKYLYRQVQRNVKFTCSVCEKEMKTKESLDRHLQKHARENCNI